MEQELDLIEKNKNDVFAKRNAFVINNSYKQAVEIVRRDDSRGKKII